MKQLLILLPYQRKPLPKKALQDGFPGYPGVVHLDSSED